MELRDAHTPEPFVEEGSSVDVVGAAMSEPERANDLLGEADPRPGPGRYEGQEPQPARGAPVGDAAGSGDEVAGDIQRINTRLALLTDQVDALQVESAQRSRPWHREPSLIISTLAVMISLIFSAIGYRQVSVKDVAEKQELLRQTVVQIVESQTELTKLSQENSGNPLAARWASGTLNSKRQVLLDTAQALAEDLGDQVDASSLLVLAGQLQVDGRYEESVALYFQALKLAKSPTVRSAILRAIGGSYRYMGSEMYDVEESRRYMQQAADLFKDQDDDNSRFYRADNLLFWAELERSDGEAELANSLFQQAREVAETMSPANASRPVILSQIEQAQSSQAAANQTVVDLRGEWQVRFAGDPAKHGTARIMADPATGTYYVSMLVLSNDVVSENRSGSGTLPDPNTVLFQWQGTRYSQQYGMPVQTSGISELGVLPGGQELQGTDSVVGEPQQAITLVRASP